jgi:hypothetical protein
MSETTLPKDERSGSYEPMLARLRPVASVPAAPHLVSGRQAGGTMTGG